jgi:hypothetical protein
VETLEIVVCFVPASASSAVTVPPEEVAEPAGTACGAPVALLELVSAGFGASSVPTGFRGTNRSLNGLVGCGVAGFIIGCMVFEFKLFVFKQVDMFKLFSNLFLEQIDMRDLILYCLFLLGHHFLEFSHIGARHYYRLIGRGVRLQVKFTIWPKFNKEVLNIVFPHIVPDSTESYVLHLGTAKKRL